ncbi:DUF7739 domain-containing protein [Streptomyces vinaceus]|uniref:DUF7739 domain-containing protein n=3 Tax=Streptomyces TaxID=1883 RepID=A0ABW6JAF0_STRWE
MGWTISHGTVTGEPTHRSYNAVGSLAQAAAHALTARDWALLRPVLHRPSGDPFQISPDGARAAAGLLLRAADSGLMDRQSGQLARDLAAAATRAAAARQLWNWS